MVDDNGVFWDCSAPSVDASVEEVDHFDARGMRRVYGREDCLGRHHNFHLDIWQTSDGRLLMRCSSRCSEIEWRSFEIVGVDVAEIPRGDKRVPAQDSWIPMAIRKAYDLWIDEEY
jgi:hypothetical protein